MTTKDKNTAAAPMTYEVQRRPNLRAQLRAAAADGEETMTLPETTVETVTIQDAPKRSATGKGR